ncbi:MAG: glutathione S-transferase [Geminicoccaceae bacterium]|nr:glutathione S-transferase [Geminicoccaceae bacterium]MDW8123167.1 glutathione S-transferase [Geminicoccaceae bacterium]
MIKIWGRTNSINVQKVMWAIGELGLDFERIDAGGTFGGLDTPEYGRMNPNRKIPTIRDGDVVVWESNACVRYLAAKYGAGSLWPIDPGHRSEADRWMDWMLTTLVPDLTIVFWQTIRTPPERRDMSAVRAAAARLGPIWAILDGHLAERAYVAGAEFTMGDIPVGCAFWRYVNLPIERPPLPHLEAWFERLKAREAYRTHVMLPVT